MRISRMLVAATLGLISTMAWAADTTTLQHEVGTMSSWYREPTDAQEAMIRNQERELQSLYADFFSANHVGLGRSADVVRLIAEQSVLTSSWIRGSAKHTPTATDRAAAMEIEQRIEMLLGSEAHAALASYKTTLYERAQLRKLTFCLSSARHALSPEQKESMVQLMASVTEAVTLSKAPPNSPEYAVETISRLDRRDQMALALFASVLDTEQQDIAKRQFADRSQRRHEFLRRYQVARAEGDTSLPFGYPAD